MYTEIQWMNTEATLLRIKEKILDAGLQYKAKHCNDKKTKEIVAFKKFSKEMASDTNTQEARLTFNPPSNTSGRVIPYAYCNKHGLWRGGAISYL